MAVEDQPRDSKGRWTKGGGGRVLAAVALAVALAAEAGSVGLAELGGSSTSRASSSSGRSQAKARDRDAQRTLARLARQGLQVEEQASDADDDCAAHSYGQVQEFFRDNPCDALFRTWYEVRDGHNAVAVVAVAAVDMPDAAAARRLQRLVDRHGTGNVTELTRERGRYRHIRFTGRYYESVREDETVVNIQAEPVGPTAAAAELARRAEGALTAD